MCQNAGLQDFFFLCATSSNHVPLKTFAGKMMMVQKENKVHIYNAKYMYSSPSLVDVGTAVDFPQRQKQIRVNIMLQGGHCMKISATVVECVDKNTPALFSLSFPKKK